ncbi:MAG: FAD-dependent oxidoreductase [Planctomycetaceae bacterium]|nr:FAD-dependent oxidoreductase [Planctomycetaceae bacterium]
MSAGAAWNLCVGSGTSPAAENGLLLVEAETFGQLGGWTIDQQAMDQMGSPFLLAHGLGVPVADATTTVTIREPGTYHVFVRTRDWVAPWKAPGAPGRFQLQINGRALDTTFGTEGAQWHWQAGGTIELPAGPVTLALHDLTGFDGRCDAILFTSDSAFRPPPDGAALEALRRQAGSLSTEPVDAGEFDFVVVGGGMAGCCAAVSAARLGCRVALVHDRPVLGGNNSSEVRVGLSGLIHQPPYPQLGNLVDQIGPVGYWHLWEARQDPTAPRSQRILEVLAQHPEKETHNAGPASNYEDARKLRIVEAEKNLRLFLLTRVVRAEMTGSRLEAVIGRHVVSGQELRLRGRLFADCTGDGNLGALAGADFRSGREARSETGETLAPDSADQMVMGVSVQWSSVTEPQPSSFPDCPWALSFDATTVQPLTRGDWDWETGMNSDPIDDIEAIRDHALRATFGNWAYLKNHDPYQEQFAHRRLDWVACIGGKRESRRLLGDVILRQQDVESGQPLPDACVTTTWGLDLHYPHPENSRQFPGQEFRSVARTQPIEPYPIPFRCLYSRNVQNLLMAGRNISVTHVVLGTVRVQRTTGMMGEVVGMAAWLCTKHHTDPRGVYQHYLPDLQDLMRQGVDCGLPPAP